MSEFSTKTTVLQVLSSPVFADYRKYLIYNGSEGKKVFDIATKLINLSPIFALSIAGWSPKGIVAGLNFLSEKIQSAKTSIHFLYQKDVLDDPQKKDVNLLQILPDRLDPSKETIVLAAGGGYNSVCTMVEALPTARHFSSLGHQVFLLTYRVKEEKAVERSISDLARAIEYLVQHQQELGINPNQMVIGGFSAGANLISNWGMYHIGYGAHGLPKPKALLPIYALVDLKSEDSLIKKADLLVTMFGKNYLSELDKYNVAEHIDEKYPPCYIVCGKNDKTVPCRNSELIKEKLDNIGIPAVLEVGENAPHGFGDGTGTDVEGWPMRAAAFFAQL